MKTAIVTAFNEAYAPIADVTLPLMKLYADRHGYGLHLGRYHENPAQLKTYGDRGKIDLYLKQYDTHDTLMWLDIDVLILNHDLKIEDVIEDRPFVWSYDCNGPCSGFWIAKCVPEVAMMFNKVAEEAMLGRSVIARELSAPHRVSVQFEPHGTSDQMMMRELMNLPPYREVLQHCLSSKQVGHCYDYRILKWPEAYDYMGNYEDGDWLYTLPSVELQRRKILLARKAKEWYEQQLSRVAGTGHAGSGAYHPDVLRLGLDALGGTSHASEPTRALDQMHAVGHIGQPWR